MCQCIYLGSDEDLGEVKFDPGVTTFYYERLTEGRTEFNHVAVALDRAFLYYLGGSEKCACSLSYDFALADNDQAMEYQKRNVSEVRAMLDWLRPHVGTTNLQLLCTWWEGPSGNFPARTWNAWHLPPDRFQFPLDQVLRLTH